MNKWHVPELSDLEKRLKSDFSEGLSAREANERFEKAQKQSRGHSKSLFVPRRRSFWFPLFSFVGSPLTVLLLLISFLTTIFGRPYLGILVFILTLAAAIYCGVVSLRAERRLDKMREYASPMVKVKRGGNIFSTDGRNLVVGDVILLHKGDLLPCDARIISCDALFVDELIGKSEGGISRRRIMKNSASSVSEEICAPDAVNMLYAGSAVVGGNALAVVVEVGDRVYLSDFLPDGALGGRETESNAVKNLRGTITKISFICSGALMLLSLLGLITFNGKEEFIWYFMVLLSAVFLVTGEMLLFAGKEIFASYITRLSNVKSAKRRKDNSAAVRNVNAFDKLTEVTDILLFGTAGLYQGVFKVESALVSCNRIDSLDHENNEEYKLLSLINTFVRAQREGNSQGDLSQSGITEALYLYLRSINFDFSGASLATKSLYLANDIKTGFSFACAETDSSIYRVTLSIDESSLDICRYIRIGDKLCDIDENHVNIVKSYAKENARKGSDTVFCVSETEGKTIFEGALSVCQPTDVEICKVISEIKEFGINTTVFLPQDEKSASKILNSSGLGEVFAKGIAYSTKFRSECKKITDEIGSYSVYVGFKAEEYAALIEALRNSGRRIAAYGISNDYNELMAKCDLVITSDTIKYSSEKHREAIYERLPAEGKDTNLRASQQTRLLSKVIVKRSYEHGGGVYSIFKAIRMSRGACVSLAQSVLLFSLLSVNLMTLCAMSVITGNILLDPVQAVSLAAVFSILSVTVFSDSEQKLDVISVKRKYSEYPSRLLKRHIPTIISRASVAFIVAVTVKILDLLGIFGESATYTLPIYICMLLTMCFEVLIINRKHTKKGEGRSYCWLKVVIAYAILIGVCAITTQIPFSAELYKNGFGSFEYLIIPGYLMLYGIALLVSNIIERRQK